METTHTITVKIDPGAPVTTIGSVPLWNNTVVPMTITATAGPSGVATIQYQLDGGAWAQTNANSLLYTAPAVQGAHTVTARAISNAGVTGDSVSVTFNIDLTGPRTNAHKAKWHRGLDDGAQVPCEGQHEPPGHERQTRDQELVRHDGQGLQVGTKDVSTWYTQNWKPKHAGTFRYTVYAKDLAGNKQGHAGWAKLTVM